MGQAAVWPPLTHDDDDIGRLGDRDDLPPAPAAHRCALDDTGQIEQLDARALVLEHAGDGLHRRASESYSRAIKRPPCPRRHPAATHRQGRKLVRADAARRLGHAAEQRRLADTREANQGHTRVPRLEHIKAFALGALFLGLEELRAILCELGFERAEVVFRGFAVGMMGDQAVRM